MVIVDFWLYSGYTYGMKTAISIPDDVFYSAESTAEQLGMARSQLYVKAIKEFIEVHRKDNITERLNTIYSENNSSENEFLDISINNLVKAAENDSW